MTDQQGLFGTDPWWLVILKVVAVFAFLVVMTLFAIWWERRVVARMQHRIGPNRLGPQGLLQSLADGIKLALKEDIIPKAADRAVFILAPILSAVPAFMAYAVMPFGPKVSIFGHPTMLQLTDLPVAVLYVIAVTSVGVYGIVLAGWASGSTYPLLGGLRSSAQVISYEVAMGLSFVAVFLFARSMSTSQIVDAQAPLWFAIPLIPSFLIYVVSMVGETNRAPFDLPEAEGELVGGFHTEYSSLKFALFFLAEYINMVTVSSLATTLFLGGWRAPWPLSLIGADAAHPYGVLNTNWWPILWFVIKVNLFIFLFIWLRGTLPRMRYDQFMKLGWKFLIPASLAWILAVSAIRVLTTDSAVDRRQALVVAGVALVLVFLATIAWDAAAERRRRREEVEAGPDQPREFDPMAGGYPVPPMPGQVLPTYTTASARRATAVSGAGTRAIDDTDREA
ncbi:MAG: NADH-quinone oxidoreductase subunit NuoH [Actinomycetales bacterium]